MLFSALSVLGFTQLCTYAEAALLVDHTSVQHQDYDFVVIGGL